MDFPASHVSLTEYKNLLVVSTHLKNISQNGNLPQIGMKIKNIWNHHLEKLSLSIPTKLGPFFLWPSTWKLAAPNSFRSCFQAIHTFGASPFFFSVIVKIGEREKVTTSTYPKLTQHVLVIIIKKLHPSKGGTTQFQGKFQGPPIVRPHSHTTTIPLPSEYLEECASYGKPMGRVSYHWRSLEKCLTVWQFTITPASPPPKNIW